LNGDNNQPQATFLRNSLARIVAKNKASALGGMHLIQQVARMQRSEIRDGVQGFPDSTSLHRGYI